MLRYFPGTEEEPVLNLLGSQDLGTGGFWRGMGWGWAVPAWPCGYA